MQNFQKWAEGRPSVVAILAHIYASNASLAFGLLDTVKDDRNFVKEWEQPNLSFWLGLYKKQRKVRSAAMGILIDPSGFFNYEKDPFEDLENIDQDSNHEDFERYFCSLLNQKGDSNLVQNYAESQRTPWETFEKTNDMKSVSDRIFQPEFYFYLRIYLPCWLLYGELPARLLRKARLGDIGALEKLIRLDSSTIFDPKISALAHRFRAYDKRKSDVIISAFSSPPKTPLTIRRVKAFIAAYIKVLSSAFDHNLNEPDIRALYDAIANDQGIGEIDTDLPESPEAFAKAIQREIPFWLTAFKSDRK